MACRSAWLVYKTGAEVRFATTPLEKLEAKMDKANSLLCVGLDPEAGRLPTRFQQEKNPLFAFCREVIALTAPYACAFKPNTAFFEAAGAHGWEQLAMVFGLLREWHPDTFTICDAKRGDIGSTNQGYVAAVFDQLGADAITLHPYLGREALSPFLDRADKVSVLLCRTSNPGAGEMQDLMVQSRPLWEHVAAQVSGSWNQRGNCMLVVGATWPDEMRRIRAVAPSMPFLVPGIGAQGGDVHAVVESGLRADGKGLLISSSRSIMYASDPAEAAKATRDAINTARERVYASK